MARKKIAIDAPAIAPGDDGVQDLNRTLSPPLVWKYIIILLEFPGGVDGRERRTRGRGEQPGTTRRGSTEPRVAITGWPNKRDKNNHARELVPKGGGFQFR